MRCTLIQCVFVVYVAPIIESISTESFSLALSLDVVLLTDGGRMVNNYTVSTDLLTAFQLLLTCAFSHYRLR